MLFHVLKGQSLSKLLQVAVITAHQPFLQSVRHLNGGLMSDKGIAVTVSSGPESNSKDGRIFPGMQGLVQSGQKTDDDIRDAVVKNVFQIPNQTDGLIERSRLLPIDKSRLTELLEQKIDAFQIVGPDGMLQVGDDTEHAAWIELGGVGRQRQPNRESL